MPHVIEAAPTGRAKCRGCGGKIDAGALRFGEAPAEPVRRGRDDALVPPRVRCLQAPRAVPRGARREGGAARRPRGGSRRPRARPSTIRRLPRVDGAERAPTGRAQCRHCREAIAKDAWRIGLVFWEEGRFNAAGYVHVRCAPAYFETSDVLPRVRRFAPALTDEDARQIERELAGS